MRHFIYMERWRARPEMLKMGYIAAPFAETRLGRAGNYLPYAKKCFTMCKNEGSRLPQAVADIGPGPAGEISIVGYENKPDKKPPIHRIQLDEEGFLKPQNRLKATLDGLPDSFFGGGWFTQETHEHVGGIVLAELEALPYELFGGLTDQPRFGAMLALLDKLVPMAKAA